VATVWGSIPIAVSRGSQPIAFGTRSIAVPGVEVVDTLGAGDVLHGALLVYLARHGVEAFEEGLKYAVGIASESCRFPGAHAWARAR
jgi:sugar/nucleoside kinase (ribokinase family)